MTTHEPIDHLAELQQKLQLLSDASSILLGDLGSEEVVREVVALCSRLIDADAYALWRYEEVDRHWSIVAAENLSSDYLAGSVGARSAAAIFERIYLCPDVFSDPILEDRVELYRSEGIRAIAVIPLRYQERLTGTLTCYFREPRTFSDTDCAVGQALANLAAVAIHTAEIKEREQRLFQQSESRARRLQRLNEIGRTLSAELDLHKLGQAVTDAATELSGAQFGAFFYTVIEENGESYMLYAIAGVPRERFSRFPMPRNTEIFAPTFRGEGTVMLDDVRRDPRFGKNGPYFGMPAGHLPVVSYLAVPVISREGEVLGGLFFGHSEEGVFNQESARLVEGLAAQAAIGIDNARLYERLEHDRVSLRTSEERYRTLVSASPTPQAVGTANAKGDLVEDSPSWRELTGQTFEEIRGRGWLDAVHPEQRDATRQAWDRAVESHEIFLSEFRLRMKNGTYRWFASKGVPVFENDGSVREWVGTSVDVDQRKSTEEHLQFLARANELFAASLDYEQTLKNLAMLAVPRLADWCAVDVTDAEGVPRRLAIAHVDPKKVELGWQLHHRYPPKEDQSMVLRSMKTGEPILMSEIPDEVVRANSQSEEHYQMIRELGLVSAMVVPLLSRGRALGAVTFVASEAKRSFTTTDLAHAEEFARRAAVAVDNSRLYSDVQRANRTKDEFLATLSHELRTPMTAIVGWAGLLDSGEVDQETFAEAIEAIRRSARIQAELIDDVLDMSRIVAGKLRLQVERLDLREVVKAALETVAPAAEARDIRIEVDAPDDPVTVAADRNRMQQVIWNLLSNAIKFTPTHGEVHVQLETEQSNARLRVIDTGQGIDPQFVPHLFELFLQAESSSTRSHGGLGLGLAIVRHLTELHGGTVSATSEGVGTGAEFTLTLPVRAINVNEEEDLQEIDLSLPPTDEASFPDLTDRTILFVDDQDDARRLATAVLSRCGATVLTAGSVAEAMESLSTGRPDVIVSDIAMPHEDGYSLRARVAGLFSNGDAPPVIAMTAFGRAEDRERIFAAGFADYLIKPVEPVDLASAVARAGVGNDE
jgi:PAS domain S-box-containing protein